MLLALLVTNLLFAQAVQSSIAGVVRDGESGRVLPDAEVSLPDLNRVVVTDSLGRYHFSGVPPGPQHLTVRRIGYQPRTLHAFAPERGLLEIDLSLNPVPMRLASLVVRTGTAIRGLEAGDSSRYPDRGLSLAAIRNDPFLPEPDGFLALNGGEVASDLESPSGMHLRGAASDQTGYLLDGIPVFSPYHSAGIFSAWNPDVIERIEAASSSPSPASPATLAGTVTAVTRSAGSLLTTQGTMSTSQARVAVEGPLGAGGAGFLVSLRAGYPGWIAPGRDPSYLRGDSRDGLAKLETPLLKGSLRLLLYDMGDGIGSSVNSESGTPATNNFEWSSRSAGAQWVRRTSLGTIRLQGWSATSEAEATWLGASPLALTADREDEGFLATGERHGRAASTLVGVRLERSRTRYHSASEGSMLRLNASTPVGSAFIRHDRQISTTMAANAAVSASAAAGDLHLSLQSQLRLRVSNPVTLSASYVRAHQFAQSLRNSESVVGNIFPAELYVGAGTSGVPVARNDRAILAVDYRPASNLRVGVQGYLSHSTGLLLVAPHTGEPFAIDGFTLGSGTVPGVALDAALRGSRYGLLAGYGWQRVRLTYSDSSYRPAYGASHGFRLGGILFPTATSSVRLAFTGAAGRRVTRVTGSFEWEACNLLDRGCEFGGNPQSDGRLGGTRLPGYFRLDLGVRQHWHLHLAGKDVMLALYGTMTNLLGRTNVLTVVTDPATGRQTEIEMRPRAPLVVGLDWRF